MTGHGELGRYLDAIADELAGIREALEELANLRRTAAPAVPVVQRMHQALGLCWCGDGHSIADAIRLNAAIDIIQPEGDSHGS